MEHLPYLMDDFALGQLGPRLGGEDVPIKIPHSRTELVDQRVLRAYLPGLGRNEIGMTPSGAFDLTQFINKSWALRRRKVTRGAMLQTFRALLQSLARNVGTSEATSIDLSEMLEDMFYEDRDVPSRYSRFQLSYQYFVCLAEIGARCHSARINSVLHQFFIKFGREIASSESTASLAEWATTIIRSCMHEREIVSCLREILLARPQFVNEIGRTVAYNRQPTLLEVYYNLLQIADRIQHGRTDPLLFRGRDIFHRGNFARARHIANFPIGIRRRRGRFPFMHGNQMHHMNRVNYLPNMGYGNPVNRGLMQTIANDVRQIRNQTARIGRRPVLRNQLAPARALDPEDWADYEFDDGFETDIDVVDDVDETVQDAFLQSDIQEAILRSIPRI